MCWITVDSLILAAMKYIAYRQYVYQIAIQPSCRVTREHRAEQLTLNKRYS
jgi:hypothetical protein